MMPLSWRACWLLLLLLNSASIEHSSGLMFSVEALQNNAALEAALHTTSAAGSGGSGRSSAAAMPVAKERVKRGAFWDIIQKIGITKNLVVDQFVDTKNTFSEVYNLVNAGFSDPAPVKPTLRPGSSTTAAPKDDSDEVTTTTEKYQISRYEFGRILGRNFRGLQRLTNIELQDAFNQSKYNIREYQAEARKQFSNSLAVEKKKQLQLQLKG